MHSMFMVREGSMIDAANDSDVFGTLKEKVLTQEVLSNPCSYNGFEFTNDPRTVTVFLTPPSSPPRGENNALDKDQKHLVHACEQTVDDEDIFRARTKDLRSMLIKDCMWNGYTLGGNEASNRKDSFERFRSLTKTPPLVDCNLRITFVDPCEIWPFNVAEQLKAGTRSNEEVKQRGIECTDEDIEVDVVGLEGISKVSEEKEKAITKDVKAPPTAIISFDDCSSSYQDVEKPCSPLTPNTSDDEYACKMRSCVKRKRNAEYGENDNMIDHKQRASSGDESDQECELGRATHNVLERKRRNELKQRFQYLRDSIPELTGNDRAPKVAILQKAFSYITLLKIEEKKLAEEAQKQRNNNARLLEKLFILQQKI